MVVDIESMLHFTSFNLKVKLSNNGLCLRCTLMGFEKKLSYHTPFKSNKISSATKIYVYISST